MAVIFLYQTFIDYRNWKSEKNPLPENVRDVYDAETYEKWRSYHSEKARMDLFASVVSFAVEICSMAFNFYALFAGLFPDSLFWGMFAVMLLNSLFSVFTLPFSYYDDMKIEEKYGFNKMTLKTFWSDQLKGFLIGLAMMVLIGVILINLHQKLGDWLILLFAGVLTLITLLITFLYPIFSKLFNKFTPLEEGELKDKLTALLTKNGYQVRAIQVMDASKRSTKMNAYFTGFGKMKTIVLYDTLKEAMSVDEICAVFAHEMGHGLHKDTLKNQFMTFLQMLVISVLAWFTVRTPQICAAFGFDEVNYGFAMIYILSVEFALFTPLFGLLTNGISRRMEYRADSQVVKEGYGEALVSALKKLAKSNFANLSPDPLVVKLTYSHPTLSQRFEAVEKQNPDGFPKK